MVDLGFARVVRAKTGRTYGRSLKLYASAPPLALLNTPSGFVSLTMVQPVHQQMQQQGRRNGAQDAANLDRPKPQLHFDTSTGTGSNCHRPEANQCEECGEEDLRNRVTAPSCTASSCVPGSPETLNKVMPSTDATATPERSGSQPRSRSRSQLQTSTKPNSRT